MINHLREISQIFEDDKVNRGMRMRDVEKTVYQQIIWEIFDDPPLMQYPIINLYGFG